MLNVLNLAPFYAVPRIASKYILLAYWLCVVTSGLVDIAFIISMVIPGNTPVIVMTENCLLGIYLDKRLKVKPVPQGV
jgi:hypothetical protein